MILYLDTSALVKRYVREAHSNEVIGWIEQAELVGSSVLTQVEMAATLAKAARLHWVEIEGAKNAWQDFSEHWQSYTRLSVTSTSLERASRLAWDFGLRGYDAMHLASAVIWQDMMEAPITLATFDRELWLAAPKTGLTVWPSELI